MWLLLRLGGLIVAAITVLRFAVQKALALGARNLLASAVSAAVIATPPCRRALPSR